MFQYLDVDVLSDRWWVVEQRENLALIEASAGSVRELTWNSVDKPEALLTPAAKQWAAKGVPVVTTRGGWLLTDLGGGACFNDARVQVERA